MTQGKTGGMRFPERFWLIKAYGAGFWCDMDHVVGGLLLAETTERTPVVYWGKNSLYGGSETVNAFEHFFRPVSAYTVHDLQQEHYRVFPGIWHVRNLLSEEGQRQIQTLWHPLEVMLSRPEEIVVSGWSPLFFLQPWLSGRHPAVTADPGGVYRYVFAKYLRLLPKIEQEIDNFHQAHMFGKKVLAVHARGSDKITEFANIHQINELYFPLIGNYLAHNPDAYIFLLTESAEILHAYQRCFTDRLLHTDCRRTAGDTPVYAKGAADQAATGREIITDIYLAMRCDAFIGNMHSNVSNAVVRLKSWPINRVKLLSVDDLVKTGST